MTESKIFLEALFADKPDNLYLLLWTLPEKDSHWFRDVEGAVRCTEMFQGHDVYVGIGLSGQNYGDKQRCLSENVTGIVGVCADLDLRSDAHPKSTLPETIEQALSILPPGIKPSFVISTGNGLQVWWLFREPYIFATDTERDIASTLVYRWHTLLRDNASQRGWTYERLADLARVLRIPGTTNCKDLANPKPVVIHSQCDQRYNPSEFEEYLDDLAVPDREAEAAAAREWAERFQGKPLTINVSVRIPEERLDRWLAADLRFKNTWFRQRHDLHDQSQSGYDLALACFGLGAGCTEQEIVDLIVHHRSLHKQKQRTRLDYFQRTLAKAADHLGTGARPLPVSFVAHMDIASPTGTDISAADPAPANAEDPDRKRIKLCQKISAELGVTVLRLVKLSGRQPIYRMEVPEGKIEFEDVRKFISQDTVRTALAAKVGKLINRFNRKLWDQLAQLMLDACDVEEGGEELELEGQARMYIDRYLADVTFIPSIEDQAPQDRRHPMARDGRIVICASDMQMHIFKTTAQNVSVRSVAGMLSAIGAKAVRVRVKGTREQGRWALPLNEFDPVDYAGPQGEAIDERRS